MKILILSSLALFTPSAFAELQVSDWQKVLAQLQSKGIQQIGDFNVAKFAEQVRTQVTWQRMTDEKLRPEFIGDRKSAFYIPSSKTVYLSQDVLQSKDDMTAFLRLHEAFGALNYNDRHYELSTALHLLSALPAGQFADKLPVQYGETLFKNKRMLVESGSGSSVAGGGDMIGMKAKYEVLKLILNSPSQVRWDFLKTYPLLNFESNADPGSQFVAMKYQYISRNAYQRGQRLPGVRPDPWLGYQELISIYIPALKWSSGGRAAILEEAKQYALELFPAYKNSAIVNFTKGSCLERSGLIFPVAKQAATGLIQQMRGDLISGCERGMAMDAMEIRVPKFHDKSKSIVDGAR